jgi:hypothetical protein
MLAERLHGPGALAALARARGQFDTPAFRSYLAGRLGLRRRITGLPGKLTPGVLELTRSPRGE